MALLFALTGSSRTPRPGWHLELAIRVEVTHKLLHAHTGKWIRWCKRLERPNREVADGTRFLAGNPHEMKNWLSHPDNQ